MRTLRRLGGPAVLVCLLWAPPAAAQGGGFVRGLGGVTFGTADVSTVLAGGGGMRLVDGLHATGELGRFQNILPSDIQDGVDLLAVLLSVELGVPVTLHAAAPAVYFTGGLRYDVPGTGAVRPFLEGQVGVARISLDLDVEIGGIDLPDDFEDEAGLESATELLIALGGGISMTLTDRLALDVGFRYNRVSAGEPDVDVNTAYAALRLVFP